MPAALPQMMNSAQKVASGQARFGAAPPPQAMYGNAGRQTDMVGPLGFNYAPQQQAHQQKLMASYGTTDPRQIEADAAMKGQAAMQNFQATNPSGFAQYMQNQGRLGNPVGQGGAADYMAKIRAQEFSRTNPGYTPFALGGGTPHVDSHYRALLPQLLRR